MRNIRKVVEDQMLLADAESKAYIMLCNIEDFLHWYTEEGKDRAEEELRKYNEFWNGLSNFEKGELEKRGVVRDYNAVLTELKNFEDELDNMTLRDAIEALNNVFPGEYEQDKIAGVPAINFKIWLKELEEYRKRDMLSAIGK